MRVFYTLSFPRTAALLLALVLIGPVLAARAQSEAIKARFVVLGPDGHAVARVITSNPTCPLLTIDQKPQAMQLRAAAETVPQRPTRSKPDDSKPSAFPVTVCELPLGDDVKALSLNGTPLPLPVKNPQNIIVIGDTGCRLKLSDNAFQPCNDPQNWPFQRVADSAARLKPDLVIHVGDLHYRENACPLDNAGCQGSPWGYGYDTFEADFFTPASALLAAAPWVFVRGNHESCERAGQGWWRFFDPRPLVKGQDCNRAEDDKIGEFSAPYAVPLGSDSSLIVFDSSFAGIRRLKTDDPVYQTYAAQMQEADRLAALTPISFYTNHHPILGLTPRQTPNGLSSYPGNPALQSVLEAVRPVLLFPPQVQALLAGHVHVFQMASFDRDHPTQFISGNGGSWVEDPNLDALPEGTVGAPGLPVTHFTTTNDYGFMTMQREKNLWHYQARNRQGEIMARCDLFQRIGQCSPESLSNLPH